MLAYQDGPEGAHQDEFNRVRSYVRKPRSKETWPFLQRISLGMVPEVKLGLNLVDECVVAAMNILSSAFFVSLANVGDPETALKSLKEHHPEIDFVEADYNPPLPASSID